MKLKFPYKHTLHKTKPRSYVHSTSHYSKADINFVDVLTVFSISNIELFAIPVVNIIFILRMFNVLVFYDNLRH